MSDRQRLLLSPYRLPTHHQVYLNEDEMAAWLNGIVVLWHPALLLGGENPPRVDSAYDHEQPTASRAYVMPDSPPQFLPDDWPDRVKAIGALKLPTYPEREQSDSSDDRSGPRSRANPKKAASTSDRRTSKRYWTCRSKRSGRFLVSASVT